MEYLVTGATGFIGRFVVDRLLERDDATIHVLCREQSADKLEHLRERFPGAADRLQPLWGDITEPGVISLDDRARLAGRVDHLFNLAAVYDMGMDDATADKVNVGGARNVVELANELGGPLTLHHVSSIAVAGDMFPGTFTEEMFEEGQRFDHPYLRTKFESERVVRTEAKVPVRIYRPGIVVGSSQTGEMDKIDGPYFYFPLIRELGGRIPAWLPIVMPKGGRAPIVPVDYVAAAIDAIAHKPGYDGGCFQLVQNPAPSVASLFGTFVKAAGGPQIQRRLDIPLEPAAPLFRGVRRLSRAVGFNRVAPASIRAASSTMGYSVSGTKFDDTRTRAALEGTGIECPDVRDYADKLWAYWDEHLEGVHPPRGLSEAVIGKVVLITGASSGIGKETARKVAKAGGRVVLVARTKEKLDELAELIEADGGEAHVVPCDLSDMDSIDAMADQVLLELGHVDILVNNAGRSIRRAVVESLDRFHDVERTMQLNYFGAIRLIQRLLPSMIERGSGHIINVSSIGVQVGAPRFSAYVASKAALDAYGRCMASEVRDKGIRITTAYMPLVRTPMIAPTAVYQYFPAWQPDKAANTLCQAMIDKPKAVQTPYGRAALMSYALWPSINDMVLNRGYKLFPTSAKAKGDQAGEDKPSVEQLAFASIFRGEHW